MEDPYLNLDPADFFNLLESNQLPVVEDIKSLIHDHLNSTKEAWLVGYLLSFSWVSSYGDNLNGSTRSALIKSCGISSKFSRWTTT